MPSRREFLKDVASGTAGLVLVPQAGGPGGRGGPGGDIRRREVSVGGRRVKVVDVHGHCLVPEVLDVIKDPALAGTLKNTLAGGTLALGPDRLRYMDEQGIDVQALSINAFWYGTDRDVARQIVTIQNEKLAAWCAARPDRFVGLASVALQHPDLAAEQLDETIRKLGLRGAAIGGSVEGEELSAPRFDPFWAKAEELGIMIFVHPQQAPGTTQNPRLQGRGGLGNTAAGRMRYAGAVRAPIAGPSRNDPVNTSRRSSSWTRWSSTKRDCGIWSPKSASVRSCTGLTIPLTGRSASISCSRRRS